MDIEGIWKLFLFVWWAMYKVFLVEEKWQIKKSFGRVRLSVKLKDEGTKSTKFNWSAEWQFETIQFSAAKLDTCGKRNLKSNMKRNDSGVHKLLPFKHLNKYFQLYC